MITPVIVLVICCGGMAILADTLSEARIRHCFRRSPKVQATVPTGEEEADGM